MTSITTHVLDTSRGRAAEDVPVLIEQQKGATWTERARGTTNADGRISAWVSQEKSGAPSFPSGTYRMTFQTSVYFQSRGVQGFYPFVTIIFEVRDGDSHTHVPLLLSPYGYSTYRGS